MLGDAFVDVLSVLVAVAIVVGHVALYAAGVVSALETLFVRSPEFFQMFFGTSFAIQIPSTFRRCLILILGVAMALEIPILLSEGLIARGSPS